MNKAYQEKLLDPRWQRRRLEIFNRDNWTCKRCGDTETSLAVHHRWYSFGAEPWDYPDDCLLTLCQPCHDKTHSEERGPVSHFARLIGVLLKRFESGPTVRYHEDTPAEIAACEPRRIELKRQLEAINALDKDAVRTAG